MSESTAVERVTRLRVALLATGDALAGARLDDLLAAESRLAEALEAIPLDATIAPEQRAVFVSEILAARAALLRCRRLGTTITGLGQASVQASGGVYARDGGARAHAAGHAIQVRG